METTNSGSTYFNPEKLNQLIPYIDNCIKKGYFSGANLVILKKGKICYDGHFGYADTATKTPYKDDTIVRMYSMTKPVTTVAAMILLERGRFQMHDPISKYLPEFANPKVIIKDGHDGETLVPAKREIQFHDLFTMTSGITGRYEDTSAGRAFIKLYQDYAAAGTVERIHALGQNPLEFSPGEGWRYGRSLDTLAALVEVMSGQRFSDFLKKEIFDPLGMEDAGFYVPQAKRARFATLYDYHEGAALTESAVNFNGLYDTPPLYEEGGSSLCCTALEYAAFAEMLLEGGSLNGKNILGKKSVEFMHCNHLTPIQSADYVKSNPGYGYGCGLRTLQDCTQAGVIASQGEFGWAGAAGTWFSADPQNDMTIVFAPQVMGLSQSIFLPGLLNIIYGSLN